MSSSRKRFPERSASQPMEFQKRLMYALGLPHGWSEVFLLCDVQGHTPAEAAIILELSPAEVTFRLELARREIEARLAT